MAKPTHITNKRPLIEGEKVFYRMYKELGTGGSWQKVAEWYSANIKWQNEDTGQPFKRMAMFVSAWKWAIRGNDIKDLQETNLEEAKKIYSEYLLLYGEFLSDQQWKELIFSRLDLIFGKNNSKVKEKWLRCHPEYIVIPKIS